MYLHDKSRDILQGLERTLVAEKEVLRDWKNKLMKNQRYDAAAAFKSISNDVSDLLEKVQGVLEKGEGFGSTTV